MRALLPSGITEIVRMLCSRSASLISSTRQSWAIAMNILRMVAACWASFESNSSRSSLVTPSTTAATWSPNCLRSTHSRLMPVSSTASCSRAAATVGRVEPEIGHDVRHGDRVGDVGLAGAAELALVGLDRGQRRRDDQAVDVADARGARGNAR